MNKHDHSLSFVCVLKASLLSRILIYRKRSIGLHDRFFSFGYNITSLNVTIPLNEILLMNCWIQVKRSEQINRIKIALRKLEKGGGFTDRGDGVITCERENRLFCLFVFRQVCQLFLHIIFIAIGTAF